MWAAETGIAAGEELAVMFVDGSNAYFVAQDPGFTGIKGMLVSVATVTSGAAAFGCNGGAYGVWIVGIALEAATVATPLLVQIHSTPYLKTLTVA
jgi:hypothetical protein